MSQIRFFSNDTAEIIKLWCKPNAIDSTLFEESKTKLLLPSAGKKSQDSSSISTRDFVISDGLLYYHRNGSTNLRGILNLSLAYINIKKIEDSDASLTKPFNYTIQIERGSRFTSIFIETYEDLSIWIKALSPHCIQTNFHDSFTALEKIGEGSFGTVFLVEENHGDKNRFAVKAFSKKEIKENDGNLEMISNEIKIMIKLSNSPNIPAYYGTYETENTIYMLMEVIEGKPLLDIKNLTPIDE